MFTIAPVNNPNIHQQENGYVNFSLYSYSEQCNEIQPQTRMNLTHIILSGRSHRKNTHCMIPFIKKSKTCNVHYSIRSQEVLGESTKGASGVLKVFCLFLSECLINRHVHCENLSNCTFICAFLYS